MARPVSTPQVLRLAALALAAGSGCDHSEPARSTAATAARSPGSPATPARTPSGEPIGGQATSRPASSSRCLVPLPGDPPPRAARARTCPPDPGQPLSLPHGWVTFPEAPGAPRVAVEIAHNGASRERGLMFRTEMPEDQGMIFSWTDETVRSFWMRNTCIPLDLLYIAADGTVLGVLEEVPVLDETPRSVPCPVAHVLEVNAGWTRAHGVLPGQHVKIET